MAGEQSGLPPIKPEALGEKGTHPVKPTETPKGPGRNETNIVDRIDRDGDPDNVLIDVAEAGTSKEIPPEVSNFIQTTKKLMELEKQKIDEEVARRDREGRFKALEKLRPKKIGEEVHKWRDEAARRAAYNRWEINYRRIGESLFGGEDPYYRVKDPGEVSIFTHGPEHNTIRTRYKVDGEEVIISEMMVASYMEDVKGVPKTRIEYVPKPNTIRKANPREISKVTGDLNKIAEKLAPLQLKSVIQPSAVSLK